MKPLNFNTPVLQSNGAVSILGDNDLTSKTSIVIGKVGKNTLYKYYDERNVTGAKTDYTKTSVVVPFEHRIIDAEVSIITSDGKYYKFPFDEDNQYYFEGQTLYMKNSVYGRMVTVVEYY